ncbi:hypothetical protein [Kitasatospora sp. NPDC059571]
MPALHLVLVLLCAAADTASAVFDVVGYEPIPAGTAGMAAAGYAGPG